MNVRRPRGPNRLNGDFIAATRAWAFLRATISPGPTRKAWAFAKA